MPEQVIAQVMNIGDYSDVQLLAAQVGDEILREVLKHAEAGNSCGSAEQRRAASVGGQWPSVLWHPGLARFQTIVLYIFLKFTLQ